MTDQTSVFDPDTFLHEEVEEKMEVSFTPVPEGDYPAYIETVTADIANTKNGPRPILNFSYVITDEEMAKEMELERPTVRQTVWLDIDESGQLSFGKNKNVRLGRIREAVGQNKAGEPWSPGMLVNAGPVMIKVGHRYNSETGEGPYPEMLRVVEG